jgi:hypothetical protein
LIAFTLPSTITNIHVDSTTTTFVFSITDDHALATVTAVEGPSFTQISIFAGFTTDFMDATDSAETTIPAAGN